MAKPILVIRISHDANEFFEEIRAVALKCTENEYHVVLVGQDEDKPEFEVYNVDKEPEIDYEQLKQMLKL